MKAIGSLNSKYDKTSNLEDGNCSESDVEFDSDEYEPTEHVDPTVLNENRMSLEYPANSSSC